MKQTTNLVEVDFRVCCSHKNHDKPCEDTLMAISKKFWNVIDISAVRPLENSEDMCIIGMAKINPSKRKQFEDDLSKLRIGRKKITKSRVTILRD